LRAELHPKGLEIVTVSLELSGPDASRRYIEAAAPEHPSLLDATHRMDALFGVVNIPNVVWIDEDGIIVRPAEPGWPEPRELPEALTRRARQNRGRPGDQTGSKMRQRDTIRTLLAGGQMRPRNISTLLAGGQDREAYPAALRDWVEKGRNSRFYLSPDEVIVRSQPRPISISQGAAHFELANHFWREDHREAAIAHFNACHKLQPDNWTYKRQAWSLVGNERVGGDLGRFTQGPAPGEEDSWPFDSDFASDVAKLEPGQYYPNTM
jgi:hypothetical protein